LSSEWLHSVGIRDSLRHANWLALSSSEGNENYEEIYGKVEIIIKEEIIENEYDDIYNEVKNMVIENAKKEAMEKLLSDVNFIQKVKEELFEAFLKDIKH